MWILKGTLLGLWLLGFGTVTFFYFKFYRKLPPGTVTGVTTEVVTHYTIQNPLWWTALVVCLVLSYAIARSWAGPLGLWIALVVTGSIPVGILTLFLVGLYKLKQANQGP